MSTLLQDIRYGFRMLVKHKGFSLIAIAVLAIGIGANTAIFSLVNGILLRPLSYPEADRIVSFEARNPAQGITQSNVSFPDFVDWSKQSDLFAESAGFWSGNGNFGGDGVEPERVPRTHVTTDFFSVLGVQPMLGRTFLAEEDKPNQQTVAIISHGLWKRRFGSDPNVIGKTIFVSAHPVTLVGIMPPGFDYPNHTGIWVPTGNNLAKEPRDNRSWNAIARLKPGVDLTQVRARVSAIAAQLAQEYPDTNKGWDATVFGLQDLLVRDVRPALLALLGAVSFVLLIACANVANLLLARAAGRRKEIAIRSAIGANRARVVRQMLTESLLLSLLGGIGGLLLSVWLTDVLVSILPKDAPRIDQVAIDYRVFAFAIGISALAGLIFGLAPALQSSRLDIVSALNSGGRTGETHHRTSARSLLLIGEVALSLVLLVGAGLLIKSFIRLQEVRPGFNPHNVLIASMALPYDKYDEVGSRPEFFRRFKERVEILPGVQAFGGTINLPLNPKGFAIGRGVIPEGRAMSAENEVAANFYTITGDYFRALEIPLLAGRAFNLRDDNAAPKVAIVNETFAKRCFGSPDAALGKRVTIWRDEKFPREIVGVVGDTKTDTLEREAQEQIYVPHAQDPGVGLMTLVVRTANQPAAFAPTLRREVQALEPNQPLFSVRTYDEAIANSLGTRRVSMQLFTVFAIAALVLAALGIYGVVAYSVTQRTQEIGIRMALGAQKSDVLRLVVRQGMTLTLIGVIAGLIGAFALTRAIASLLFGVAASDPVTFIAIALLLVFVAFIACYLPARRAAKLDPVIALNRQ